MSQYTQKAILYTFQEMLEKMSFDKITVSAIVSNCEISSNTFYYHYRDIYDLLDTWLLTKKEKYLKDFSKDFCWQDSLKILLNDIKENSNLVYHLFDSLSRERIERYIFESSGDIFYQIVRQEIDDADVSEETLRDIAEYNSYSLLGFFLKYLWNHMDGNIDEGVDKISSIFRNNLQWAKK